MNVISRLAVTLHQETYLKGVQSQQRTQKGSLSGENVFLVK